MGDFLVTIFSKHLARFLTGIKEHYILRHQMNDYNVLDICGYAINLSPILAGPGFAVRTVAQVQ